MTRRKIADRIEGLFDTDTSIPTDLAVGLQGLLADLRDDVEIETARVDSAYETGYDDGQADAARGWRSAFETVKAEADKVKAERDSLFAQLDSMAKTVGFVMDQEQQEIRLSIRLCGQLSVFRALAIERGVGDDPEPQVICDALRAQLAKGDEATSTLELMGLA